MKRTKITNNPYCLSNKKQYYMPLETIIFQETHEIITPIGTIWRKIGGTYRMEEGDVKEDILGELKSFVSESHKKVTQIKITPKDKQQTFEDLKKELNVIPK
jgi:hypothetical protein